MVQDLAAFRSGDTVELRFTLPRETTDGLPLRDSALTATFCRQDGAGLPCRTLPLLGGQSSPPLSGGDSSNERARWRDSLPEPLRSGAARPLLYRVEVRNAQGRSAGFSAPVVTAAGMAPPQVQDLRAEGRRTGVLLQWTSQPGAGEVLLQREATDSKDLPPSVPASHLPAPSAQARTRGVKGPVPKTRSVAPQAPASTPENVNSGTVWLQADPGNPGAQHTLDGTVTPGVRYRYTAVRRQMAKAGGRELELRGISSLPVEFVWNDIYPPPTPEGVTAVAFGTGAETPQGSPYAVDLIWQPVEDLRVTGYLVWRVAVGSGAGPDAPRVQLTPVPVPTPAFHDATASPTGSYRYEVSAVDAKGNTSPAGQAVVQARLP